MPDRSLGLVLLAFCSFLPWPARAQVDPWKLRVAPRVSWYKPDTYLRIIPGAAEFGGDQATWLSASPAARLDVELGRSGLPLSVRAALTRTLDTQLQGLYVVEVSRTASERRAVGTPVPVADASVTVGVLDLVATAPEVAGMRLYALLGGGFKRYGFAHADLPPAYAGAFARDETVRTLHYGVGAVVPARGFDLVLEAGQYHSRFATPVETLGPDGELEALAGHSTQRDLELSLGLRFSWPGF